MRANIKSEKGAKGVMIGSMRFWESSSLCPDQDYIEDICQGYVRKMPWWLKKTKATSFPFVSGFYCRGENFQTKYWKYEN